MRGYSALVGPGTVPGGCTLGLLRDVFFNRGRDVQILNPREDEPGVCCCGTHWQIASDVDPNDVEQDPVKFTAHVSFISSHAPTQVMFIPVAFPAALQ